MQVEQTGEGQPLPREPDLLHNPLQFLAFGMGSGLSPHAPGTMGTLAAIPIYLLFAQFGLLLYTVFVIAAIALGIWLCGRVSEQLNVHDHPGIVWDEFAGYWVTMWAVPKEWLWVALGFVVFRILDIVKPWPISLLDRRVGGGWGIMVDDLTAGLMACLTLHIAHGLL